MFPPRSAELPLLELSLASQSGRTAPRRAPVLSSAVGSNAGVSRKIEATPQLIRQPFGILLA